MEIDRDYILNFEELVDLLGRMGYYFDKPNDQDLELIHKMQESIQFFYKYDNRVKFEDILQFLLAIERIPQEKMILKF